MKILFVASEVNPIIKSGGLADVIGALPKQLNKLGADVRIAIPDYPVIDNKRLKYIDQPKIFTINLPSEKVDCWVSQILLPGTDIPVYVFKTSRGLLRPELYPEEKDGDQDRFLLFSLAVTQWLKTSVWQPSIVHCHDWMTGAIPQLIKQHKLHYRTLFTIHNLFYQGLIGIEHFKQCGIEVKQPGTKVNMLRMGIKSADYVNTVSPTYAEEALTIEYGSGLEQALKRRGESFSGILNGIDYEQYSPQNNANLVRPYSQDDVIVGKAANKHKLQQDLNLEISASRPLFGFVGRLTDQKGLDLIESAVQSTPILEYGQLVILGEGDGYWERKLMALAKSNSGSMVTLIKFDEALAHQIYAASDFFLAPSRFEPCGLIQLIAMKFGSLPVVRRTGGLADTVIDQHSHSKNGTGVVFSQYSAKAFSQALGRSVGLYKNSQQMTKAIHNAMRQDFSWTKSAHVYFQLYHDLLK